MSPYESIAAGPWRLDADRIEMLGPGVRARLRLSEWRLARLLLSSPGKLFQLETIMRELYDGSGQPNQRHNVRRHVATLRRKLGAAGRNLVTVRSFGYRWDNEVDACQ